MQKKVLLTTVFFSLGLLWGAERMSADELPPYTRQAGYEAVRFPDLDGQFHEPSYFDEHPERLNLTFFLAEQNKPLAINLSMAVLRYFHGQLVPYIELQETLAKSGNVVARLRSEAENYVTAAVIPRCALIKQVHSIYQAKHNAEIERLNNFREIHRALAEDYDHLIEEFAAHKLELTRKAIAIDDAVGKSSRPLWKRAWVYCCAGQNLPTAASIQQQFQTEIAVLEANRDTFLRNLTEQITRTNEIVTELEGRTSHYERLLHEETKLALRADVQPE